MIGSVLLVIGFALNIVFVGRRTDPRIELLLVGVNFVCFVIAVTLIGKRFDVTQTISNTVVKPNSTIIMNGSGGRYEDDD